MTNENQNESKIGLSISIENMSEEVAMQQEALAMTGDNQNPPF
jgi:hypothetical protein